MGFFDKLSESLGAGINAMVESEMWSNALYLGGHPDVKGTELRCTIALYKDQLIVNNVGGILFTLNYDKIVGVRIIDLPKKVKKQYMADVGISSVDNAAHMYNTLSDLFTKDPKADALAIIALGKDKDGNSVNVPIVFTSVQKCKKLKEKLDEKINKTQGVTI